MLTCAVLLCAPALHYMSDRAQVIDCSYRHMALFHNQTILNRILTIFLIIAWEYQNWCVVECKYTFSINCTIFSQLAFLITMFIIQNKAIAEGIRIFRQCRTGGSSRSGTDSKWYLLHGAYIRYRQQIDMLIKSM